MMKHCEIEYKLKQLRTTFKNNNYHSKYKYFSIIFDDFQSVFIKIKVIFIIFSVKNKVIKWNNPEISENEGWFILKIHISLNKGL